MRAMTEKVTMAGVLLLGVATWHVFVGHFP